SCFILTCFVRKLLIVIFLRQFYSEHPAIIPLGFNLTFCDKLKKCFIARILTSLGHLQSAYIFHSQYRRNRYDLIPLIN
ncbi:MAG: hypothetical protein LBB91_08910, partial [Clostridiales bacterium]|nr:hypothetical protein [Clostridiales bacterium]